METRPVNNHFSSVELIPDTLKAAGKNNMQGNTVVDVKTFLQEIPVPWLEKLMAGISLSRSKKNFLVFKNNKYINVLTDNIAMFYVKYDTMAIICFDRQEYFLNYSLEQIQQLLSDKQFFRLNRQYLINFAAIKEVEHYFARKLLVNPVVPARDKLLVSKEKVSEFLHWLDDR